MASWLVAFLVGVSVATFAWNKAVKQTNRNDTALTIGIATGVVIFLVVFTFLKFILNFS